MLFRIIGGFGVNVIIVIIFVEFSVVVLEINLLFVIVFIKGVIIGVIKVRVGSNKSIIGFFGLFFRGIGFIICY